MRTIYLASGNAHKLHELQTALEEAGLPLCVKGPAEIGGMPEVEETGSTFEANSLLKAQGLRSVGPADGWFLADDSGIEIDALEGRPGVISARYAGAECDDEANNDKVIEEMKGVPEGERSCRFRCVLALVGEATEETFSGACQGTLLFGRRGEGGFGYDPLFLPDESESTFAEISLEEKAKISHRARALAKLVAWLENRRKN
ncbi:MAG: RdgB/HAM1 family non-canonical purine NTP pyrophosphatase [Opitutae bacterium]|jgi:XTP/dITP diphosphohydrolase|nr:RdgB/HAM1 family non-canonical purine NTP pyrophosphatase [Opitutae bacterium]